MRDSQQIRNLVERIVRDGNLPNEEARNELRRELLSHFEDAASSPDESEKALQRFGSADVVAHEFHRAYGRGRRVLYAVKVVASIVVSLIVALGWQALVNLRLEPVTGALRIGPWYGYAAIISALLVAAAVLAWEIGIEPLCTRLERNPARLLAGSIIFTIGAYVTHLVIGHVVAPEHALMGSAATIAVWVSTIAILSRFELAYIRRVGSAK